jgi:hypothetical protein
MLQRLFQLAGAFCSAHPKSKLPAACEMALEFAKGIVRARPGRWSGLTIH